MYSIVFCTITGMVPPFWFLMAFSNGTSNIRLSALSKMDKKLSNIYQKGQGAKEEKGSLERRGGNKFHSTYNNLRICSEEPSSTRARGLRFHRIGCKFLKSLFQE